MTGRAAPPTSLVAALREAAGLTQEEAAERAGMSVRGLSNLERGLVVRPRRASLDALAGALELTDDDRRRLFEHFRPGPAAAEPPVWRGPRSSLRDLVGRHAELADLRRALRTRDLVTVTGPGGCGKTALALAAATGSRVPVTVLALGSLARPEQLLPALVTLLQVRSGSPEDTLTWVERALSAGEQLLVVDNAEHLADAVADLVVRLRGGCPQLTVLVTSREPLGLSEELVWRLLPLRAPVDAADAAAPAAQLFRRRTLEAVPTADLSDAGAIGRVCRRLDGLPLALELAAARVRALPVPELADRLDRGDDLLTSAVPGPAGRRTLEQTIDWSYRLLDPDEQLALAQLSVFSGHFDAAAVEAVVAVGGNPLAMAAQLVDRSLLQAEPGGGRYVMLRTIRDYAAHRLAGSGELAATRGRHLDHWLDRGRRLNAVAAFAPRQEAARAVAADLADAEQALAGGLEAGRELDVVELAHCLLDCWNVAPGHIAGGERWLAVVDRLGDRCPPRLRAVARTNRAQLLSALGDKPACRAQLLAAYADMDVLTTDERLDIVGMLLQTEGRLLDPAAPGRADQLLAELGPCSDDQRAASLEAIVTVDLMWDRWDRVDALLAELGELVGTTCGWLAAGYELHRAQVAARRGDGTAARAALAEAAATIGGLGVGRHFTMHKSMAEVLLSLDAAAEAHEELAARFPVLAGIPDLGWKAPLLQVPQAEAMRRLGLPDAAGTLRSGLEVARADRMAATALSGVLVAAAVLTDGGDAAAGDRLAGGWQQVRRTIGLPVPRAYRRAADRLGLDPSPGDRAGARAAGRELDALVDRAIAAL